MKAKKNIYLIGMMGSWKTTVGRILSKKLGRPFTDTDTRLMEITGMTTDEIFKTRGEDYFRDREARLLKRVAKKRSFVVSTGGGIILRHSNRQIMKSTGTVFLLHAHIRTLVYRMKTLKNRPLLSDSPHPEYTLTKLWHERKEFYHSAADYEINTEELSPPEVCHQIIHLLERVNG